MYDENGSPFAMSVKNANSGTVKTYYYEKNLQGDIVGIMNEAGYKVVNYTYDAWGNPYTPTYIYHSGVSAADRANVELNPFRYRGYYYDSETGYYYLQTRYYNPDSGRFLNADGYVNANGDILGYNMFAYCSNNPVMGYDPEGTFNVDKFFNGGMLLAIGVLTVAAAISVASCGTATPLVIAIAAVAFATGAATAVNGASDIVESVTDYNPVREIAFNGDEEQYAQYEMTMAIGTQLSMITMSEFNVCFKAGTAVSTENGNVAIESIKVGDLVWATDPETGETALKTVVQLFCNETDEWIHVKVNGDEIICTPEHPFYSPVKGWTSAIDLRAGDILVMLNGEYVVVEQVQHELLESPETTYNFEVEGFHTYCVGEIGVLVHNSCKHNSKWNAERKRYWKGEAEAYSGNVNGQISDSGTYKLTSQNYCRMLRGKAPIGTDGYSVQLHHYRGISNDFYAYGEILRSEHTSFYKMLHPWLFKH
mgnify:FL=1